MISNVNIYNVNSGSGYNSRNSLTKTNTINFLGKSVNKVVKRPVKYITDRVCDVENCKSICCYNVPLPRDLLEKFADKIVNTVLATKSLGFQKRFGGRNVLPITKYDKNLNKCPFLTLTNRCNIYENRPYMCKAFGTIKEKDLDCPHQIPIDTNN